MIIYLFILFISTLLFLAFRKRKLSLDHNHFLITGGSSGIGLALAILTSKLGSNVTIIARSEKKLEEAKRKISSNFKNPEQKVSVFSADITDQECNLEDIVREAEKFAGPITVLINCAGTSGCYPFLDTPVDFFSKILNVNYLGSVYMTRAVLPLMKKRKSGSIVFVSSVVGLMGLYGYTAYSASKFAIVGFAESLQMEVKPDNISITIAFPPDTDTPGFAEEVKGKPIETVRISESAGLFSAEEVASSILSDIMNKKFSSTVGFSDKLICTLCSGMMPVNSFVELLWQAMTMGILRLGSFVLNLHFDGIIKKCAEEKQLKSQRNASM